MALVQSHKIEYKDCDNIDSRIELWEEVYGGALIECEAGEDPLIIDIAPMDPTIFMPVIGTGATITVLSVTTGQHLGLYTKNPIKKLVKIFKNNQALPWWLGYINTEQYGEDYSRLENYPVTIHCNNGFNVLNRFKYLNGLVKYTTLETPWNILTRILAKTGLPYQYIYFASKLICDGVVVSANETIFHQLKEDQLNYYDENDEPMTYRAVLESLLLSYGLQIRQEEGSVFIYEPQMLADASFSAKRFNGSTYAYIDTVNVSRNFNISDEEINWDNEDSILDVVNGFSKQRIRYSPYPPIGAIEEIDVANRYLWTGTETWTADLYDILRLSGITAIAGMTLTNCAIKGHKEKTPIWVTDSTAEESIYIESSPWLWERLLISVTKGFKVAKKEGQYLKVSGEVYIRSKYNELSETEARTIARRIEIPLNIEVDGKGASYDPDVVGWSWEEVYDPMFLRAYINKLPEDITICDQWMPFSAVLPWNFPGGEVVLKIWDPEVFDTGTRLAWNQGMKAARFKNLKIHAIEGGEFLSTGWVKNANGKEIVDEDVLYQADLDDAFMNEAPEFTVINADAKNITDRGAVRKADNLFTSAWRKTGDAADFRLLDLLLRSIISQYQDSLLQLSGTLEAKELTGANGGPNFMFTLQDTDYSGTKKMMFNGGSYSDYNRTLNGSFLELKQEDLTISLV